MTPGRITPAERVQLSALLGALSQSASFAPQALSIFGDITGEMQQRQQRQQEQRQRMKALLLQQQSDMMQHRQDALLEQQQSHYDALGELLPGLLDQASPETQVSTTTKTNQAYQDFMAGFQDDPAKGAELAKQAGISPTIKETTRETVPGLSYQDLMAQFGALSAGVPGGLSGAEFGNITGAFGDLYRLDPQALQGIQHDAMAALQGGVSHDEALKNLLAHGADQGYNSPDEMKAIRQAVSQVYNSSAPGPADPAIASQGDGQPGGIEGIMQSLLDAVQAVGPGTAAAGAGAATAALGAYRPANPLKKPSLAEQSGAAYYEGPGRANIAQAPAAAQAPTTEEQAIRQVLGELGAGRTPIGALPAEATGVAGYPIQGEGFAAKPGPAEPYLSPLQRIMLGEGQPLEGGGGLGLLEGGAAGALGLLGGFIPQGLQMGEDYDEKVRTAQWQSLTPEQQQQAYQAVIANGTMDPQRDTFDWQTGKVVKGVVRS